MDFLFNDIDSLLVKPVPIDSLPSDWLPAGPGSDPRAEHGRGGSQDWSLQVLQERDLLQGLRLQGECTVTKNPPKVELILIIL
jgi:hypothetical protein